VTFREERARLLEEAKGGQWIDHAIQIHETRVELAPDIALLIGARLTTPYPESATAYHWLIVGTRIHELHESQAQGLWDLHQRAQAATQPA
jgi:hypothetical protein